MRTPTAFFLVTFFEKYVNLALDPLAHCMSYVNKNSEWYQLIHQAATLDLNHGLFLVGDKDAQIIFWPLISSLIISSFNIISLGLSF